MKVYRPIFEKHFPSKFGTIKLQGVQVLWICIRWLDFYNVLENRNYSNIFVIEWRKAMAYKYREVKCPWCDHIFMWSADVREGLIIYEYRLKESGKLVEKAKCPKCSEDMLVLEHILEGIDTNDNRIEKRGISRI